jgi:hypothetical protein
LDHLRYVVKFCWTAHKKLLLALCYTVGSHHEMIQAWAKMLHTVHIMPASTTMKTGNAMMQGMTDSLATLTKTMTSSYIMAAVREEKKENGFKKLGAHHQRMILKTSTVDVHLPVT